MKRLASIDALRGFDMIWILGLEWTVRGFCKLFPGGTGWWFEKQFHHVAWDGLAFFDTIFPLFVFIAGVSFPFSYAKQVARGDSALKIHLRLFRRAALLILLGMVYNGVLAFKFETFRYSSVLGKIGLAWLVAALWYVHFGVKVRLGVLLATLGGYWALLHLVAPDAPAGTSPFALAGCFPGYLDRLGFTPGDLYCKLKVNGVLKPMLEPSGVVVSSLGSSASALMGMLAGDLLCSSRLSFNQTRKTLALAGIGVIALIAGWLVSLDCPIIKNLWTPSFSLVVGGYSFLMLALFYWIIDVKGHDRWCFFLKVVGVNSITIYMLKRIVDYKAISRFLFGGVASWFSDPLFIESLGMVMLCWLTCWFLNRQKIYLKI
ncbi:MAG: DUF5009 domain-containing protein [Kiritimatiellae bacterium]|nr:DUF5009 domain-containing protein [Kiritimatiellia bacterium]